MKPRKLNAILSLALAIVVSGCESWHILQIDPDAPTDASPSSLLSEVLLDMHYSPWDGVARYNQFHVLVEPYYGNQNYLWTTTGLNYESLMDVVKMEQAAARASALDPDRPNAYRAMGKYLRAYYFVDMSRRVGDVPLHGALKGEEGVYRAEYDTQKEVFRQSLDWLEEANTELAAVLADPGAIALTGDVRFNGDIAAWQRVVNSFRLRVLITLSHHADEADLRVKEQFAAILSDPARYPLIRSNHQNLRIDWIDNENGRYPSYVGVGGDPTNDQYRNPLSSTYLDILIENKDPRIFVVAEPTDSAANSGDPDYATKFTSFKGADTGELQGILQPLSAEGKLSWKNANRYSYRPTGESTPLLSWAETEFNIAEGLNRGWAIGSAATHYQQGIRASMEFYGVDPAAVDAFLEQPTVQYAGDTAEGLEQILTQKYVAFFQNSGWEAFFNQRRTGVPEFSVGPGNDNRMDAGSPGRIPWRWMYPAAEYQTNRDNIMPAVQRQYGGTDDINSVPWLWQERAGAN